MPRNTQIAAFFAAATVLFCGFAFAQSDATIAGSTGVERPLGTTIPGDDCAGGVIVDNGDFVNSRGNTASPMVQRFTGLSGVTITKVCAVLQAGSGSTGTDIDYDVVFLAADGPGGTPGTELARISAQTIASLNGFPDFEWFSTVTDYSHASGDLFIGITHEDQNAYVGWDTSGGAGNAYYFISSWTDEGDNYGVRLITGEGEAPAARATFEVTKDFTDGNPNGIEVSISCNTGLPLDQSKVITEAEGVTFVVTDFDEGELDCEITEDEEFGYDADYFDGSTNSPDSCEFLDTASGDYACAITNTPAPVDIVIDKEWVFEGSTNPQDIDTRYDLTLFCDAEIVGGYNPDQAQEAPAGKIGPGCGLFVLQEGSQSEPYDLWCKTFYGEGSDAFNAEVIPEYPDSECYVIETTYDDAVEVDNGCGNLTVSAGNGDSCTITNTVFFEGIPTLNQYGLAVLALLMLGIGFVGFRRIV